MIAVVNLGISNLSSVLNALKYLELPYFILNNPNELCNSSHIILPGVGTFGEGMKQLENRGLTAILREEVLSKKKPVIGICLGMQLLFESSEESPDAKGLSLIQGKVIKLPKSIKYTIPRIGWAESNIKKDFLGFNKDNKIDFYYIHSYYCKPEKEEIISITDEEEAITCAINKNNIYGCQFHPEKSHKAGLNLLKHFASL